MNIFDVLRKRFVLSALMGCIGLTQSIDIEACTGIKLVAKDKSIVHGRTLEFGIQIPTSAVIIPRNFEFKGTTPQGNGLSYKSKYAAVGAIAFDNMAIMDGMNEKGLAVGSFYFPGYAEYSVITPQNQSKAVSPVEFSNWLVTQFASVDEVKAALNDIVIAPTVIAAWGNQIPPFHYIVYDKQGHSLVIEPVGGKLKTYDNPLGVLTNSPTFDWHFTNLRNYINLRAVNVAPLEIDGMKFAAFGQGSGLVGLPGDFTPPSRFTRASIFTITAIPSDTADQGVLQVFHILNQFDIPVGVAREVENGVIHTDSTLITCARDPQSLKYYFKTYEDQTIRMIDLNKFDLNAKSIKLISTTGRQPITDISSELK